MLLPDLHLARDNNEFILTWPTGNSESIGNLSIAISNVRDHSGDTYGEFHAEMLGGGRLFGHRKANLVGTTTVDALAKIMGAKCNEAWGDTEKDRIDQCKGIFSQVIDAVLTSWRQGEPVVWMHEAAEVGAVTYAIDPFIPEDDNAVIFGQGDSKKGWLAIAMALHWAAGKDLPNGVVVNSNGNAGVLYLDWEASEKETARRFQWMARGMGMDVPRGIGYKRMFSGIADQIDELRRMVKRDHIGLVIIDSMGPAAGGKLNSDESAIPANNAIRHLSPANRLIIAHISKGERAGGGKTGPASIIGSVFFDNLARSSWKIETDTIDQTSFLVGMIHAKVNTGKKHNGKAFNLRFDDNLHTAAISAGDLSEHSAALTSMGTIRDRMILALKDGVKTRKELAELTNTSLGQIRYVLHEDKKRTNRTFQVWDSTKEISLAARMGDDDIPF
jgi:hypothetical protein